jgi:hypothetical protein
MAPKKSRLNVYILGIAIIVAVILGYYLPTKRPESGMTLTPKQYIELVEKKKAQRRRFAEEESQEAGASADATLEDPAETDQIK